MTQANNAPVAASFRDPSGFLFRSGGKLYRQVNQAYRADYDLLTSSGLLARLVEKRWLVDSPAVDAPPAQPETSYVVLAPEEIPTISYPYEWCFSQLKDAALLTLKIHKLALQSGMALKDASAYNIQFHNGRPILIDTLSFEAYHQQAAWVAYRQFCQHFLAPLALMAYCDVRLNLLSREYIDGIPLDLASRLLPFSSRFNSGILAHIHLHAGAQKRYAGRATAPASPRPNPTGHLGLIDHLEQTVRRLQWQPKGTAWADYYDNTNYTGPAFESKKAAVTEFIQKVQPEVVWDLGANTGPFSRIASQMGILTYSIDSDPAAVEVNYRQVRKEKDTWLLPLVVDLTNPTPAIGWMNEERDSLAQRSRGGLVLALALIHHLAISNNVPLPGVARFFASLGQHLVIEFVPKEDSQVQRLLSSRVDIFDEYHPAGFESAFSQYFRIIEKKPVEGSQRVLYRMERC